VGITVFDPQVPIPLRPPFPFQPRSPILSFRVLDGPSAHLGDEKGRVLWRPPFLCNDPFLLSFRAQRGICGAPFGCPKIYRYTATSPFVIPTGA
jgi:hypothetical protein